MRIAYKAIFNAIEHPFPEAVTLLDQILASFGAVHEGMGFGARRTGAVHDIESIYRADPGHRPEVTNLAELDSLSFALVVDWDGQSFDLMSTVIRTDSMVELTLGFDSQSVLRIAGKGWLERVLEAVSVKFNLSISFFDEQELRYGSYSITEQDAVSELGSDKFLNDHHPLLAMVKSGLLDADVKSKIERAGCKVVILPSRYEIYTWL